MELSASRPLAPAPGRAKAGRKGGEVNAEGLADLIQIMEGQALLARFQFGNKALRPFETAGELDLGKARFPAHRLQELLKAFLLP